MTKEIISLSRDVKERDEKLDVEKNKFVMRKNYFLFISIIFCVYLRNQGLTKENLALKQRAEIAEERLKGLQKVNEVC